ncbi:Phosphoglycerate mutase-like protein 2 [Capsicum baccatum]|uniref:Phosphoglycerate mutase-like protein 2 n=1 Tax=Capsicum baccatum TaxID=33114 RepID=A0A2G2X070_CAPBA|nr:Phosphoglycerate mutase-like protein 2 [Capsicum baccatum]
MWMLQYGKESGRELTNWGIANGLKDALEAQDMDVSGGQSLYPLHRCKTVHLVRHAQGVHNVEGEKDHSAYRSPHLFDAHLTPLGWQQVDNLRKHVHASGIFKKVELVITSPLLRCMQTAVGVFGGEGYTDGIDVPPLMVTDAGESNHPAISSLNCPPFIAVEGCREHLGVHWCDKRRSISEYKPLFPAIDFSLASTLALLYLENTQASFSFLIESDDDVLWKPDVRELNKDVVSRGMEFFKWLWTRKEKEIAIVTHSGFLTHTLGVFGNDCHPDVQREIHKRYQNCELRSMVIVDRSMIESDSSVTDYPGKIPSGEDAPSDDTCSDQSDELPN